MRVLYAVALVTSVASAIDCSVKELQRYDFQSIKGEYTDTITKDTPPSKSVFTWSIGICQNLQNQPDCPENSDICGTTRVHVDDKDVLSEVIGFSSNSKINYIPYGENGKVNESGISIGYMDVNWGDSLVNGMVHFICAAKGDPNEDKFKLIGWNGHSFQGEIRSPAACRKGRNIGTDNGESWGWFTWIFIFMVLFLSIYIIGGAWFQYNKGNAIDFQSALKEVLENFVDLLKGLPAFIKEVVEKVTGNSNRGEYSAV